MLSLFCKTVKSISCFVSSLDGRASIRRMIGSIREGRIDRRRTFRRVGEGEIERMLIDVENQVGGSDDIW